VPVISSVGAVYWLGRRFFWIQQHSNEAVEETSSEGDDGDWNDLITDVGLPLIALSITLKDTAEWLRENEREDTG